MERQDDSARCHGAGCRQAFLGGGCWLVLLSTSVKEPTPAGSKQAAVDGSDAPVATCVGNHQGHGMMCGLHQEEKGGHCL